MQGGEKMIDLPRIPNNCKYYILDLLIDSSFCNTISITQVRSHLSKNQYRSARLVTSAIAFLVGQGCIRCIKHLDDESKYQPDRYYITEQGKKYLQNKLDRNHLMFNRDFVSPCKIYQVNPVQLNHGVPVEYCDRVS